MANLHPDVFGQTDHDFPRPGIGYACSQERGFNRAPHKHWRAQLIYAISGSLKVVCDEGIWIVPPERAVWMPGNLMHEVFSITKAEARYLYLDQEVYRNLPRNVTVVQMTPVMRECLLSFLTHPRDYDENGPAPHLLSIIVHELRSLPVMPLHLPQPTSAMLREVIEDATRDLTSRPQLDALSRQAGLSARSFERRFQAETGVTWRKWWLQAKLLDAISRLSMGERVGDVAHALGYEGTSSFIAMFRAMTGSTPGQYFKMEKGRSGD